MRGNAFDLWMPRPLPSGLEASESDYKMARHDDICQFKVFFQQQCFSLHCPLLLPGDIQSEDVKFQRKPPCHGGISQLPDRAWSSAIKGPG